MISLKSCTTCRCCVFLVTYDESKLTHLLLTPPIVGTHHVGVQHMLSYCGVIVGQRRIIHRSNVHLLHIKHSTCVCLGRTSCLIIPTELSTCSQAHINYLGLGNAVKKPPESPSMAVSPSNPWIHTRRPDLDKQSTKNCALISLHPNYS